MVQEFHGAPLGLRLGIPIGVVEGAKLGESEATSVGLSEGAAKGIKPGAVERDGATEMDWNSRTTDCCDIHSSFDPFEA